MLHHVLHKNDNKCRYNNSFSTIDSKNSDLDAQVANDDVCASRRVVTSDADMSTGFMAVLCQFPDFSAFQRQVAPGNLHTSGSDSAHDEGKKEGVAFLTPRLEIGHEGRFVDTWGQWIDEIEKKGYN